MRKKISTTIYITPEQNEQLKRLNDKTKVPVAEYIRQGIDLILQQYAHQLPGYQLSLTSGVEKSTNEAQRKRSTKSSFKPIGDY